MAESAMDRRFGLAARTLKQQETAKAQQEKEGLRRRFASIGGLKSGASVKAESLAEQASAKRLAEGLRGLEISKLGEQERREAIERGQEFQTSERVGTQEFVGAEGERGRKHVTSERVGTQEFVGAEGERGRKHVTSERLGTEEFADVQGDKGREFVGSEAEKDREIERIKIAETARQFDDAQTTAKGIAIGEVVLDGETRDTMDKKTLVINEKVTKANLDIAKDQAKIDKEGFMGQILGKNWTDIKGGAGGLGSGPSVEDALKDGLSGLSGLSGGIF